MPLRVPAASAKVERLGVLHMRGTRHWNAEVTFGLRGNGTQERGECRPDFACGGHHVHPELSSHHFVATAAGVELCAQRSQFLDELGFGEMVNVFGFGVIQPRRIRLRPRLDFIERGYQAISLLVCEDSRSCNGTRPGAVESQLVREKAAIEAATTARIRKTKRPGRARSGRPTFSALRKRSSHCGL